jgi:hypothetical protein
VVNEGGDPSSLGPAARRSSVVGVEQVEAVVIVALEVIPEASSAGRERVFAVGVHRLS